ncbi:MAG: hypothetical protein NVSMB25_02820 [Thermoleophilaceae bacterium]
MNDAQDKDLDEHPERAAALHEPGQKESHPDEGTDDARWDTDQHSDASGPFGTG